FERAAVGVGKLARDVEAKARSAGTCREKRLDNLSAVFHGHPGSVVAELADDRVAHVARAGGDSNASFALLAVLPCVANEIPGDLAQMPAIEHDEEVGM